MRYTLDGRVISSRFARWTLTVIPRSHPLPSCIFGIHGGEQVYRERRVLRSIHRLYSCHQDHVSLPASSCIRPHRSIYVQVYTLVSQEVRNRRHPRGEHLLRDQRLRDRKHRGYQERRIQKYTGTASRPYHAHTTEREHVLHLEAPAEVKVLLLHHSKPSSGEETTEPICAATSTSAKTQNYVDGGQSCCIGNVTNRGGTSANEGDEVNAEFGRGRS